MNWKLNFLPGLPGMFAGIEKSIDYPSSEFDKVAKRLDAQAKETKQLNARVISLEKNSSPKVLAQIKGEIDEPEWRNRSLKLESHGTVLTEKEDLLGKINYLGAQLRLERLVPQDVVAVNGLPSKPGKIPGVIARFAHQELREK